MSLSLLPAEILECILAYLDGISLCFAKQVCKTWQYIIKRIESGAHWRTLCVREVPHYILEELLGCNYIPPNQSTVCWHSLYRKWFKGKMQSQPKHLKESGFEVNLTNPITCMRVSGSFVITGHSNGYLCVWNHETGKFEQQCKCHLKTITDIVLLDQLKLGTYFFKDESHWSHHHMITVSKDCIIRLKFLLEPLANLENDLIMNKHGDIILSARVFGDKLFVYSRDNTISYWKLKTNKLPFLLDIQFLALIIGPANLLASVGLWNDELFCITRSGTLQLCNIGEDNTWSELTYFTKCWGKKRDSPINKCYNFRNRVVVILTVAGEMLISESEGSFKLYNPMSFLRTAITCIALKGTIFALGGENGVLYLYYAPDNKSLLNLSEETATICLSEASIIAIDILYEIDYPIVVASTTNGIYVIRLMESGKPFWPIVIRGTTNKHQASTSNCA